MRGIILLAVVLLFVVSCSGGGDDLIGRWEAEVVNQPVLLIIDILPNNEFSMPPIPLFDTPQLDGGWHIKGNQICVNFAPENIRENSPELERCFDYDLDGESLTTAAFSFDGEELVWRRVSDE